MSKYCATCGAPTKEEVCIGNFDTETGKPIIRFICSLHPCEHNYHDWSHFKQPRGLLGCLKAPTARCRRCGKECVIDY